MSNTVAINPKQPQQSVDHWPKPQSLPAGMPEVEPFTPGLLPSSLVNRCMDIAERMQCAPDFPAVGTMVALGSLIGREVGIHPKRHDDWLVVPNLWGCIVGRPSVLKSPALAEATSPLGRMEAEARSEHKQAEKEHNIAVAMAEMRQEAAKKAAKAAMKKGNETEAEDLLAEAAAADLEAPTERRYRTNDATVEKLGELLAANPRGLLMFRDELAGWLAGLDKEGREGERGFFLEAFNGSGSFTYDRIGRGTVRIDACTVSVLGGTQPGKMAQYVRHAIKGGYGDDGLMQRFQLLVWPNRGDWRHVDRWPDGQAKEQAFEAFQRLAHITADEVGAIKGDYDDIAALRFDDGGQVVFDDWYATLMGRIGREDMPSYLESHLAKYASLMPSLALIIHLAEEGVGSVPEYAAQRAAAWCEYLESHAKRMYAPGLKGDELAAIDLAKRVKRGAIGPQFTPRELYRKGWGGLSAPDEAGGAIDVLEDCGWIAVEMRETTARGKPTTICTVNPRIAEVDI